MELICSFYIGHASYLEENPDLEESESQYNLAQAVDALLSAQLGEFTSEGQTRAPKDATVMSATLEISGTKLVATEFGRETAVMDDDEGADSGFPVLLYVDAHFQIPEDLEEELEELADLGDLDDAIENCELTIGTYQFAFEGSAELL